MLIELLDFEGLPLYFGAPDARYLGLSLKFDNSLPSEERRIPTEWIR